MGIKYDKLPYEWTYGDPKRIWQAQISGEKNFEKCSFMGALNDLQVDTSWKEAFSGLEECTGMKEFIYRLQGHFDLCNPPNNPDGSFNVYHHPSRTKNDSNIDKEQMLSLGKRHINTFAEAYIRNDETEWAEKLLSIPIQWKDDAENFFVLEWREQLDARDGRPAGFHLWESWDFEFNEKGYWDNRLKKGSPKNCYRTGRVCLLNGQ